MEPLKCRQESPKGAGLGLWTGMGQRGSQIQERKTESEHVGLTNLDLDTKSVGVMHSNDILCCNINPYISHWTDIMPGQRCHHQPILIYGLQEGFGCPSSRDHAVTDTHIHYTDTLHWRQPDWGKLNTLTHMPLHIQTHIRCHIL